MNQATELIARFWEGLRAGQFDILQQLGYWNYVFLAVLVTIEGPIVTLVGAAAAAAGILRPGLVFAAAMVGNITADLLWYTLGYFGRLEWITRYGGWFGVRQTHIDALRVGVTRHVRRILLIAKLTLSFVIPALVAAGLARVPWRRWFPVLFIAETFWTGLLVILGVYATESIQQIEHSLHQFAIVSSVVILLILAILILRRQLDFPGIDEPQHNEQE